MTKETVKMRSSETEDVDVYIRKQNARPRHCKMITPGENPVDQGHKDNCNINNIVNRYRRDGYMPPNTRGPGTYQDVSEIQGDLTEVLQKAGETKQKVGEALKSRKEKAEKDAKDSVGDSDKATPKDSDKSAKGVEKTEEK